MRCDTTPSTQTELEILRGDLARLFHDKIRDRVDYNFGDVISAINDEEDQTHVHFESGRGESYDLVLVAEGVGSSTRELMFQGENRSRRMDTTNGYFTIPRESSDGTIHAGIRARRARRIPPPRSIRHDKGGTDIPA